MNGVVVARFEAVVAVAAVSDELETLCCHSVASQLALVPSLKHRLYEVSAPIAKLIGQKMSDGKLVKVSLLHEPAEVARRDCLFDVKGARIDGPRRLFTQPGVNFVQIYDA